jgi:hypothetical protein
LGITKGLSDHYGLLARINPSGQTAKKPSRPGHTPSIDTGYVVSAPADVSAEQKKLVGTWEQTNNSDKPTGFDWTLQFNSDGTFAEKRNGKIVIANRSRGSATTTGLWSIVPQISDGLVYDTGTFQEVHRLIYRVSSLSGMISLRPVTGLSQSIERATACQ